jgi:hypothetical protein
VSLTHLHGATKLSQVHPIGKRAQLLFTQARRRGILRTSPLRSSTKFVIRKQRPSNRKDSSFE